MSIWGAWEQDRHSTSSWSEDILTPLGITTPYTDNGGNLTLELTIEAADVRGVAQVFSDSFTFVTYPLQVIQLIQ